MIKNKVILQIIKKINANNIFFIMNIKKNIKIFNVFNQIYMIILSFNK